MKGEKVGDIRQTITINICSQSSLTVLHVSVTKSLKCPVYIIGYLQMTRYSWKLQNFLPYLISLPVLAMTTFVLS